MAMAEYENKSRGVVYQLGDFQVQPDLNEVRRGDASTHLDRLSMDVLVHLIENAPQVVSLKTLLEKFWPATYAEESTIHRRINQIRRALGDSARAPSYVETVPKRGYRVIADVRRLDYRGEGSPPPAATGTPDSSTLRIAVLPFANFSQSSQDSYLADGFHEDILSAIASTGLQVISRTSVARYATAPNAVPIRTVADELDVSHVLEGSVRRDGDQVRIAVQLIDAVHDVHLWAATYDRHLTDLFAIQSDVAYHVTDQLSVALQSGSANAASGELPDANAYDLLLQARALVRIGDMSSLKRAEALLEAAIRKDPSLAQARAQLAEVLFLRTFSGAEWADVRMRALSESAQALEIDPNSVMAHLARARLFAHWEHDTNVATQHYQRALELQPTNSSALTHYAAFLRDVQARPDLAVPYLERALSLDPLSAEVHAILGGALMDLLETERASQVVAEGLRFEPNDRDLIDLQAAIQYARGDIFGFMQGMLRVVAMDPTRSQRQLSLLYSLSALGEVDAAERWVERIGRTTPTHIDYFNARRWLAIDRRDTAALEHLIAHWQALNSDRRTRVQYEGIITPFGSGTQMFLLSLRAHAAQRAGRIDEAVALRRSAVEIGLPLLRNSDGTLVISLANIILAFCLGTDLVLLDRHEEAVELFLAVGAYPDGHHEMVTVQFVARALAGDVDAALDFAQATAHNFQAQSLLDYVRANEFGRFQPLAVHPRFLAYYRAASARNAALRRRLREELPSLMDASHGL